MGEFFQTYKGTFIAVGLALGVVMAVWLLAAILNRRLIPGLKKRLDDTTHPIPAQLIGGLHRPLVLFLRVAGVCWGLIVLCRRLPRPGLPYSLQVLLDHLPGTLHLVLRIAIVLAIAWGLMASSDVSVMLLRGARNRLDLHMSKSVSRFLAAVFNVVVVAVAAVIILSELNYDINGLVAGLGLGGLTVALAAKDSAANFFGGLVLVTEKPFEIGDFIACSGVEGTVEDINLRSTKVRTASGSLTIVPNADLAGAPITNWSGVMEKRRADFTLGLTYDASHQQLRQFTQAVQTMLETDPEILHDSITVRFADFGASSLDVRIIFYTALPGFGDHIRIRERVNYAIMDLAQKNGVEFAFPTQTVVMQKMPPPAPSGGVSEPRA